MLTIDKVKLNQRVVITATGATGKVEDFDRVCVKVNGEWYLPEELESSAKKLIDEVKFIVIFNFAFF